MVVSAASCRHADIPPVIEVTSSSPARASRLAARAELEAAWRVGAHGRFRGVADACAAGVPGGMWRALSLSPPSHSRVERTATIGGALPTPTLLCGPWAVARVMLAVASPAAPHA